MPRLLAAPVAVIALVLAALIGSAAPAGASTGHSVDPKAYRTLHVGGDYGADLYQFASPSGNVRCQVGRYEDSNPFSCVAMRHTWKAPKLPVLMPHCRPQLSGALYALNIGDGFYSVCAGDPAVTHRGRTLRVGDTIRVLSVTCTAVSIRGKDGMRCTAPHRTGLTMTATQLRYAQPRGWRG